MGSFKIRYLAAVLIGLIFLTGSAACVAAGKQQLAPLPNTSALETINKQCEEQIGAQRIERISEHVWAAEGFEFASTILIHTNDGNVIVDTSLNTTAARVVKKAMMETAPPGPVKAIIYTHSHVDHTMGATEWAEKDTQIWAADSFVTHWFKQFGMFGRSEMIRGMRQMAYHLSREEVPCSAVGPILRTSSLQDMAEVGPLMPTNTFSGIKILEIGGIKIELHSAPGETHDTLFVWIPDDKTLLAADDYYWAFPNLYTIRGASPRPTDEWIKSIDEMRRLQPEHLVPSSTSVLHGKEIIREILTNYRDAIQYVRDEVVRRANRGEDIDTIAENVKLPPQLADLPYLWEGYGQVDWSARAIYTNNLGWFDGRADRLYPMDHNEAAKREIKLMGGEEKIISLAYTALKDGDPRWAVHLLSKLKDSGLAVGDLAGKINKMLAQGYRQMAADISNTNGRAYLLESALELDQGPPATTNAKLPMETVASMPIDLVFFNMPNRLDPEKADGVLESVRYVFPDLNRQFTVTIRNRIAEVVEGDSLPGTPDPLAVITVDSLTYKMMALKMVVPMSVFVQGKVKVDGSMPDFVTFMSRFQI